MVFKIKLKTINDIKEFVNITMRADEDVDLVCGKYCIDGKSIMGIFSLEIDKPIQVRMADTDFQKLRDNLEQYITEEE